MRSDYSQLKDLVYEKKAAQANYKREYEEKSQEFKAAKVKAKECNDKANLGAPLSDAAGNDLPLKAQLEDLPESLDEVRGEIVECEQSIRMVADDPHLLAEYEKKQKEIANLSNKLENAEELQQGREDEMKEMVTKWKAKIVNKLKVVDERFQKYMAEVGCAGGVTLVAEGKYSSWGIAIKVRFRGSSSLATLSAQVHSGGERSVSTILFLMALQDMMVSPFRCVDEINQGMDEIFERRVFTRVVQNACDRTLKDKNDPTSHSGQYFLITPKLLPNLTDMENENVTLLIIYNGPFCFSKNTQWDPNKMIQGKKRKAIGNGGEENNDEENNGGNIPKRKSSSKKSSKSQSSAQAESPPAVTLATGEMDEDF